MPAPENNSLYTVRLDPTQLDRIARALRDPNRSRIVRTALDTLEAHINKAPSPEIPASRFTLPPKRTLRTGRVQVTVRVDETLLEQLKASLGMTNTQVLERALEVLHAQEIYAKLPKLNQEEQ